MAKKTQFMVVLYCVTIHKGGKGMTRIFEQYEKMMEFVEWADSRRFCVNYWEL